MTPERYQALLRWLEARPALKKLVIALNRWLPAVPFACYPLLLVLLNVRWFRLLSANRAAALEFMQLIARAVFVPAFVFLGGTLLRARLNFPRPYEQPGFTPLVPKETHGKSFPSRHALSAAVLAAVPEGCRVAVDLGCGTGAVLERLLPASRSLIGVDGSARMLEMCRRRFNPVDLANENRISLRIGELDHLPLRDQEADFACINLVLHHLSDPGEGLREIRRSLTTGGHLFVADFLQHHDETMRSRYGDRWLGFDEERLQERLRQAGFEVLSCTRQAVGRGLFLLLVQARAC